MCKTIEKALVPLAAALAVVIAADWYCGTYCLFGLLAGPALGRWTAARLMEGQ